MYNKMRYSGIFVNLMRSNTEEHQCKIICNCSSKTEIWRVTKSCTLKFPDHPGPLWLVEKTQVQIPALPFISDFELVI